MLDRFRTDETYTDSNSFFSIFGLIIVQTPCRCKIWFRFRAPPIELLQLKCNMISGGMTGRGFECFCQRKRGSCTRLPPEQPHLPEYTAAASGRATVFCRGRIWEPTDVPEQRPRLLGRMRVAFKRQDSCILRFCKMK